MNLKKILLSLATLCACCYGNNILSGDVTVGGLFKIQNEVDGECDGIAPLSVKGLEAVKWIFRKLNEANYIPGVTIGLDVWPTCGIVSRAIDHTVDMLLRIREERTNLSSIPLVGLVGPEYSSEAQKVSYMLSTQRSEDKVLQVGFSTTAASLSDSNIYNNFVRVVPSDAVQSKVMVALMEELQWNYVAIIHDNDVYGTEGKEGLMAQAAAHSICIAKTVSLSTRAPSLTNLQEILNDIITNVESPISGIVVFTSSSRVKSILSAATSLKKTSNDPLSFILSEAVGLSDTYFKSYDGKLFSSAQGVYVVNPPRLYVNEFEKYWKGMFQNVSAVVEESQSNPWLLDVYEHYSGCLPSNDTNTPVCPNLDASQLTKVSEKSTWTSYAMKAAYVLAKYLKKTQDSLCPVGSAGICNNLRTKLHTERNSILTNFRNDYSPVDLAQNFPFIPAAFENVSITFNGSNDVQHWEGFPDYEVYQYRKCINDGLTFCFEKLGSYHEAKIFIDKNVIQEYHTDTNVAAWPNINYAQCRTGRHCSSCINRDRVEEVYFQDGDLIVGGIVPVFDAGTGSPVSCGAIRKKNGNEIVQAFEYAINIVNRNTPPYDKIFPGKKIGFLILNSCDQPTLIKQKLLQLLHKDGNIVINGKTINLKEKLIGFVGPYSSGLSVATANIFSVFKYVQVAYASTANGLSDRQKYPYYARVSTPDKNQARAMIEIIKHDIYGSSSYIQIVYSKGTYGEAGRDEIKTVAEAEGICIIQEIEVDDGSNFNEVLPKLRNRPSAKIIILFVRSHHVEPITSSLNKNVNSGEFMFIGSEAWGYRPDFYTDKQKLVGSIILSLQLRENKDFTNYLHSITAETQSDNPWLQDFISAKYNCHIARSFDKTISKACDPDMRLANNDTYTQEIWTPFALNAMFVLLGGCSDAFIDLCGSNSLTICQQYLSNPNIVKDKIMKHKIDLGDGNSTLVFDDNGDGNVGYTIYNLQRNQDETDKIEYRQVGKFSLDSQRFVMEQSIVKPEGMTLPSVCPNTGTCPQCQKKRPVVTSCINGAPSSADSNTPLILGVIIGVMAVALSIVIIIAVMLCRKLRGPSVEGDNYLTPMELHAQNVYYAGNSDTKNFDTALVDSGELKPPQGHS